MRKSSVSAAALGIFFFLMNCLPLLATGADQYVEVYNPVGIREDGIYVDKLLLQSAKELKPAGFRLPAPFPETKLESVKISGDAASEIDELFYRRGWTDGLPIVPPTPERVRNMLRGSNLSPDFVVAVLEPMNGQATIEKIAVNAVMAGCKPEYMPVLIAAVEALADPALDLRGLATTTSPDVPLLILTGPIIKDIDFNAGSNTMGRGRRANSTIGRAVQLIINNVGGSRPNSTDMSSIGSPAEYGWVVAENAEANPWSPLNLDLGMPASASVVAIVGGEGIRGIIGSGYTSEGFLKLVAAHMAGLTAQRPHWGVIVLVIAKETAAQLARDGWDKKSIAEAVLRFGGMPFLQYKERFKEPGWSSQVQYARSGVAEPDELIPLPSTDHFIIFVAGGTGEKSMIIPGWLGARNVVSRQIRLPWNWEQLIKAAPSGR